MRACMVGLFVLCVGNDYYIITTAGYIKDGPLPVARDFPDIPSLPVNAAYSTIDGPQKTTHIVSVRGEYILFNVLMAYRICS